LIYALNLVAFPCSSPFLVLKREKERTQLRTSKAKKKGESSGQMEIHTPRVRLTPQLTPPQWEASLDRQLWHKAMSAKMKVTDPVHARAIVGGILDEAVRMSKERNNYDREKYHQLWEHTMSALDKARGTGHSVSETLPDVIAYILAGIKAN